MQSAITAIGTANPPYKRSQKEIADVIGISLKLNPVKRRLLKAIYKSSGIEERYSVLSDYCKMPGEFVFFPNEPTAAFPTTAQRMAIYKHHALTLALHAIQNCLARATNCVKKEITHLITVSCTGMYAPGIDIEIVQQLELNSSTNRMAINFMGCYGAFNGMKAADAICRAHPDAKVLVVCIELCSIHFQKDLATKNIISNAIFADGAAAILVETKPQNQVCLSLESFYCDLIPQTKQEMAWHIADHGFDIVLSAFVPEVIKSGIASFMEKLLSHSTWSPNEIDYYAIHPGGLKILQACEAALTISADDNRYSYEVLRKYGNMSSATVLFVLKSIWDSLGKQDNNKSIFSCAFGPGLTLESVLLKIHHV
ncbi:TPA: type III polyketide synthase [Legionella feeleii]